LEIAGNSQVRRAALPNIADESRNQAGRDVNDHGAGLRQVHPGKHVVCRGIGGDAIAAVPKGLHFDQVAPLAAEIGFERVGKRVRCQQGQSPDVRLAGPLEVHGFVELLDGGIRRIAILELQLPDTGLDRAIVAAARLFLRQLGFGQAQATHQGGRKHDRGR